MTPEVYHPLDIEALSNEDKVRLIDFMVNKDPKGSYTIYVTRDGKTYSASGVTLQKVVGIE